MDANEEDNITDCSVDRSKQGNYTNCIVDTNEEGNIINCCVDASKDCNITNCSVYIEAKDVSCLLHRYEEQSCLYSGSES